MNNPLLRESSLVYGAIEFDKIQLKHYIPAFEEGIKQGKAEIDAIVNNPDEPTFENTIEALEYSGALLSKVEGIFFNVNEADTSDQMQEIAEQLIPMLTEYNMYISLNEALFARVKAVWAQKDALNLDKDQQTLLENTYKDFVRSGANLDAEQKELYAKYSEELSLLNLQFQKNSLACENAYTLNILDEADLDGLPEYAIEMAAEAAKEHDQQGWTFTLDYPSYIAFMKFSTKRELRKQINIANTTIAIGGEWDNTDNVRKIVDVRLKIANLLGYQTYADYVLEERMAKSAPNVLGFLDELLTQSLPCSHKEVAAVFAYAKDHGFDDDQLYPWDWTFWAERYKEAEYSLDEAAVKPYLRLENCVEAVFDLAHRLYDISFEPIDLPVYHKDVKVYDVKDPQGEHLALFYVDFFPRASKRSGAWMTEFRGQKIVDGVEYRPFVSIVTNFTKPTSKDPSLITHDELTTLLHEFGHSLHGMLAQGRYGSLTGTNVSRDFVELPSQIMENWAFEQAWLETFAKHYQTGEVIPQEMISKIVAAQNYNAAYAQVRQLQFGILDMAWHSMAQAPAQDMDVIAFEKAAIAKCAVLANVPGSALSTSFNHIFSGGYSAGYYSYKWSEVLEADAFSLFQEKGIFSKEAADAFRTNILEKGGSEDEAILYRNFRGHDPEPAALLKKLKITK